MQDVSQLSFSSDGFVEKSRRKVMNIVCVISALLALVSAFIGSDSTPYMISLFTLAAVFVVCIVFNSMKALTLTEYFVTFATTLWIIYMCIAFGRDLGEQNYLIIAIVALAIYSTKKVYRITSIIIIILLTVSLNLYQRLYAPLFESPKAADFLFAVNVITPLTIIVIMCWNVLKEAMLAQRVIEQQKQDLADAVQFKDKVFSIIGHDMRSPFNSTKSLVSLLENDVLTDEERKNALQELRGNIDVSLQTLDNILGWASQGYYGSILNAKTKIEALDVYVLVEKVVNLFNHLGAKKQVTFQNDIAPATFIAGDLEQVSFVLRNLTSNALKFSHAGQIIRFASSENKGKITVCVQDEGVGMSKEMIASLFQITTRFSKEGTTQEKGTGLGLIFCKEFIENNHGDLWVESELGKGTTVKFSLPKFV